MLLLLLMLVSHRQKNCCCSCCCSCLYIADKEMLTSLLLSQGPKQFTCWVLRCLFPVDVCRLRLATFKGALPQIFRCCRHFCCCCMRCCCCCICCCCCCVCRLCFVVCSCGCFIRCCCCCAFIWCSCGCIGCCCCPYCPHRTTIFQWGFTDRCGAPLPCVSPLGRQLVGWGLCGDRRRLFRCLLCLEAFLFTAPSVRGLSTW